MQGCKCWNKAFLGSEQGLMISSCIEEDKPYTLIVLLTIFTTLENNVLKHRKKELIYLFIWKNYSTFVTQK